MNDCPSTDCGTSITYTVPKNSYMSFTSILDANQMAAGDLTGNGQGYANQHGEYTPAFGAGFASNAFPNLFIKYEELIR